MNPRRMMGCVVALTATLLLATGCASMAPHASQPTPVPVGNVALMTWLGDQPYVTAEGAYRATHILWTGEPYDGDYASLEQKLVDAKIASACWGLDADQYVNRAVVGHLVARAIDLNQGLNWMLTGLGRYAWRELILADVASASSEYSLISGGEFLGVLFRAEEYKTRAVVNPVTAKRLNREEPVPLREVRPAPTTR